MNPRLARHGRAICGRVRSCGRQDENDGVQHTRTMLRAVAFARAQETGGRPSVSALITELAEQHRAELEREAGV